MSKRVVDLKYELATARCIINNTKWLGLDLLMGWKGDWQLGETGVGHRDAICRMMSPGRKRGRAVSRNSCNPNGQNESIGCKSINTKKHILRQPTTTHPDLPFMPVIIASGHI